MKAYFNKKFGQDQDNYSVEITIESVKELW
jgi:hypothetical protein